jgi:FeS assembly SUF system regulator
MLRMSKMADYGTVIMTSIAREPGHIHSASELASRVGVAVPTVSKVLKTLAREGLLLSLRGAKGGYMLPRPAAQISVAQIIGAMDGPIGMTECSTHAGLCTQESGCAVRANWQIVNHIVLAALQQVTLDQMTQPIGQTVDVSAIKSRRVQGASVSAVGRG